MSDKEQLLSFGFPPERVDWALKATGGRGLQPALDFLFENDGKPIPSDLSGVQEQKTQSNAARTGAGEEDDEDAAAIREVYGINATSGAGGEITGADAPGGSGGVAQSIKCVQCGKVFRDTGLANFHAEKSGHDQFEESTEAIKPLTEEEKKERLAELRSAMLEKRSKKAVEEAKEQKANEALRRKAGQDMGAAREAMKIKEANKEAEKRKQEKIDDAKARAAIKAQIEADKRERAEKIAREKALRDGHEYQSGQAAAPSTTTPASASTASATGLKGSDYPETRLQIRLSTGGPPLSTTLPSTDTLRNVAEFVAGQNLAFDVENITFTMQFPRKTFSRIDLGRTLKDLGLTPSAVLIAAP
ncbi:hypothetical protein FRB94_007871 [Tulasnella sp. JGI-2019a]|nr:hypothetical protein FRB94_007871 [Tulasnella sp. JGI-2019a]KAG9032373.1 hypothetical protein FRB95_001555 [Tulasnella sp. JGI-2019a]